MIRISNLCPKHLGRAVVYVGHDGTREDGVITSWNEQYIFVRYGVQLGSKATNPADLTFLRDAGPA